MKLQHTLSLRASLLATALLTTVASAQNVGIGTTTPKSKLSVNGSTAAGGIAVGDATYTSTTGTVAPLNGAIIQGRVGIGTPAPGALLHVLDGNILRDNANGTASTIISSDGAVEIFRQGTGSGIKGFVDLKGVATDDFGGRLLYWKGADGVLAPPNNTGEGLALTTNVSNSVPQMLIASVSGNVGIGSLTPTEARLVVRGGVGGTGGAHQGFTQASSGLVSNVSTAFSASIYASNSVVAEGLLIAGNSVIAANSLTFSDSRLKDIKGVSDSTADLEILKKLHITDYTMKDATTLGAGTFKKVIAQQVEEVYPQAVSKGSGYLPDVYAPGTAEAQGDGLFQIRLDAPHHLEAGTKVKLLVSGEAEYTTVEAAAEKSFTVKLKGVTEGGKVFVHGRQVNDLRTVDYEALGMLNVSATQELAKEVAALKTENEKLKAQAEKFDALAARMEAMEKTMTASTNGREETVRTVSLTK